MRKGSVDDCDCLNLDEEIRTGRKRWYRGHGAERAEIAGEYVGVLFERVRIGNVGTRQDDFGCLCPRRFEADLDILACLLDLRPHVALADNMALLIDGPLRADICSSPATLDPDDHRRRVICTWCPDERRFRLMRDGRPVRVRPFDIFGQVRLPASHRITGVGQVKLAVDDGPSLGIDRVLVRTEDRRIRHTPRAITIVLRCVAIWVSDE